MIVFGIWLPGDGLKNIIIHPLKIYQERNNY